MPMFMMDDHAGSPSPGPFFSLPLPLFSLVLREQREGQVLDVATCAELEEMRVRSQKGVLCLSLTNKFEIDTYPLTVWNFSMFRQTPQNLASINTSKQQGTAQALLLSSSSWLSFREREEKTTLSFLPSTPPPTNSLTLSAPANQ